MLVVDCFCYWRRFFNWGYFCRFLEVDSLCSVSLLCAAYYCCITAAVLLLELLVLLLLLFVLFV